MDLKALRAKGRPVAPTVTERSRRVGAATEAQALGPGGIALVERATGISRSTIQRGLREVEAGGGLSPERIRRPRGGRKPTIEHDPAVLLDLDWWSPPRQAIQNRPCGGRPRACVPWRRRCGRGGTR